jgi:methylenetetrahydrofolate dehydrogenase (NADP+)/methenyltetrahydrofolate cyclohydrolase
LNQKRIADNLGVKYYSVNLKANISFDRFKKEICALNNDRDITGIIINKPFPQGWEDGLVFSLLDAGKDVEGAHPLNLGKFFIKSEVYFPPESFRSPFALCISPTVLSVISLLNKCKIDLYGRKATIVGFSSLIGKPLAFWLANKLVTVNIAHIATFESGYLAFYVKEAEILISAVGKPHLIRGEWIKKGAIVIDVGTGKRGNKLIGDVDFEGASKRASAITPVPGGVGKLTAMFLFHNLVLTAKRKEG